MAINSVSSSSGNKLRLSGLATGLDTDSIISGLMKVDKIPLDKVKQSKQLAEWKRDSYRDVTNILRGFKDEFFDVLKPSSYMMSQTSLKKFSSTSSDSTVVTATGGADASMGDHKITVTNLATAATVISSDNVTKDLQSISAISSDDIVNSSGKKITITLDGVSKEITLGDYTNTTTLSDFASDIQDKIGLQFGQGKVKVDVSGVANNQLTFSTSGGATKLTLSSGSTNDGLANLYFDSGSSNRINLSDSLSSLKTKLKSSFNFATDSDGNQNVVLNINSKKFTFSSTTSLSTVLSTISNDSDSGVKIAYDDINDKFSITSKDTGAGNNIQLSESTSTFLSAINFKSFKGAQAASLSYSNEKFNVSIDGTTKEITLNGNYGDYSSLAQDVQDKIRAAFTDKQVTVTANTDNSLSINLNSTGSTLLISSKNPDASNLGFTNTNYRFGEDAQVKIDGQNITRSSNTITTNGVTYNVLKESNTEQTVSLKPDTDTVFNNIKNFVTKYNDMIAKLNGTVSEQYDRDYPPLTDDQKAAMTADQITSWETKAKTGLLKDDYNLNRILNGMRTAMYDSISGLTTKLTDIGISTGDYSDKGKLIIDESKLKDAIANNPDGVMNLFSKKSDTYSSYSRDYTSDQRKTRYSEEGISQRISDIIEDNISTIRDSNGNKGILLQIAGITGDVSEYSNNYYTQISEYDTKIYDLSQKLTDKENQYYEKYAALEAAISKMNSQSSWLASQVGGSSS